MSHAAPLCPHCGAPAPSLEALRTGYQCHYCGRAVEATAEPVLPPAPAPEPAPRAPRARRPVHVEAQETPGGKPADRRWMLGYVPLIALGLLLAFGLGSPRSCSAVMLSGETDTALAAVRKCPLAMQLLGDDPEPSWIGCATGKSQSGCDTGSGHWSVPVSGDKARGELQIGASKHRKSGWRADSVIVQVGDRRVDAVACRELPPLPDD